MKYKRLYFLLLIPMAYIIIQYAKINGDFAEFYSTNIYPMFAQTIGLLFSLIPFSVAEILIILLVILLLFNIIRSVLKTIKYKSTYYIKKIIVDILVAASIVYFLFVLFCGINYYRYEFTYYSDLEIKPSSKEDLIELCKYLINEANYSKQLVKDSQSVKLFEENNYIIAEKAKNSFNRLSNKYEVLKGNYSGPKPVIFSRLMSYTNITGIFFPFTFEANVNIDIPYYQIPSTMLHELVHLRGFMREDEANFISYLVCINSEYEDFYYSGTMLALIYSMNALYSEDYNEYKLLYNLLSDDVKMDLKLTSDYWKQFETKVAEISEKVNDAYLKSNNQKDGIKSYGRMVDLLLAYYKNNNLKVI